MDYVNYVINVLQRRVPKEVINIAVTNENRFSLRNISTESQIEHKILRPTVLLDTNLLSGLEVIIPIENMDFINDVDGITLLRISDKYLHGRKIISALSLANGNESISGNARTAQDGFSEVMKNSSDWTNASIVAKLEVVSGNEVLVYKNIQEIHTLALRVNVEYSNRFNEINPKSYPKLGLISSYAAEAWIYTEMRIRIGEGQLYHGHSLSSIESVISDLSGSMDLYNENLPLLQKILFMNDAVSMDRFIKNMIPNNY